MANAYLSSVVKALDQRSYNFERKEILIEAVKKLKAEGYSNAKIIELFEIEIKQDNSVMLANNADYLALLNQVLNN